MFSVPMLLQVRRAVSGRLRPLCVFVLAAATAASACDKAPLLAPGGTVIFLNAVSPSVAANGRVEIIAVLLEQGTTSTGTGTGQGTTPSSGTPVHNGTLVSFTSTIGRIEPAEARTENGQVKVAFIGDGRSGAATILAYSGGARTEITLNVGAAAAERVLLSATPLSSTGGTSTVSATVEDTSGNPLAGVAVQFSTSRGSVNPSTATTNAAGVATTTLTTSSEAIVTATVGSKSGTVTVTPAARSGLTITAPTTITASSNAQFTVTVTSGAPVRDVNINWGDGESTPLGALNGSATPSHMYARAGSYTVTATATMTDGTTEPVSTSISVGAFTVSVSANSQTPNRNQIVTFTATVLPNTTNVSHYLWNFGDGETARTDGPSVQHAFANSTGAPLNRTVTVTVVPVKGDVRENSVIVTVQTT